MALVIFAAGFAGGFLVNHYFCAGPKLGRYAQFKKFMGPQRFEEIREHLQRKFTRELNLDEIQQGQLHQILIRGLAQVREKAAQHDAEIEAMKEALRQEFAAILEPAQKTHFWKLVEDFKARRARAR